MLLSWCTMVTICIVVLRWWSICNRRVLAIFYYERKHDKCVVLIFYVDNILDDSDRWLGSVFFDLKMKNSQNLTSLGRKMAKSLNSRRGLSCAKLIVISLSGIVLSCGRHNELQMLWYPSGAWGRGIIITHHGHTWITSCLDRSC